MPCASARRASTRCAPRSVPCWSSPTTSGCSTTSCPTRCTSWPAASSPRAAARSWHWSWRRQATPSSSPRRSSAREPSAKRRREMTVAVTRTKAEQAYSGMFEAVAARLPGGRAVAEARKAAIGACAGLGLPHRRIEEWKYTDLRAMLKEAFSPSLGRGAQVDERALEGRLGSALAGLDAVRLVFLDGAFAPALSRLDPEHGKTYHFDPLTRGLEQGFDWLTALLGETDGPKSTAV